MIFKKSTYTDTHNYNKYKIHYTKPMKHFQLTLLNIRNL